MVKKGIYIMLLLISFDMLVGCVKKANNQHCTTSIVDLQVQNVALSKGAIYGTPVSENGMVSTTSTQVTHESFAVQIDIIDSVTSCSKMASLSFPSLFVNSAYAYDPVVSAHTTDRIKHFYIISNNPGLTFIPGDTINNKLSFHTYLLDHRKDNLSTADAILGYNTLLDLGSSGSFYGGDYLPKLYVKLKDAEFVGVPLSFKIVVELKNGRILERNSPEVVVAP
jgi:hypothetical protein